MNSLKAMLLLIVTCCSLSFSSTEKINDFVYGTAFAGMAVAGYCQKSHTVYVNISAIFFTGLAIIHIGKGIIDK